MRSRLVPLVLALSLIGLVALTNSPAPAAPSAYEMYGGGTLTAKPDSDGVVRGMPACTQPNEYGNQGDISPDGNCNSTKVTSWQFGSLPIFSKGVLFGQPQAAAYNCGSSTVTTTGGTDNFQVTFSFNCAVQQPMPTWDTITGFFSSDPNGAAANTGCTGPCGKGVPYWEGEFRASDAQLGSAGPVAMKCSGMFEPTAFGNYGGTSVTAVVFEGECTAVSPS